MKNKNTVQLSAVVCSENNINKRIYNIKDIKTQLDNLIKDNRAFVTTLSSLFPKNIIAKIDVCKIKNDRIEIVMSSLETNKSKKWFDFLKAVLEDDNCSSMDFKINPVGYKDAKNEKITNCRLSHFSIDIGGKIKSKKPVMIDEVQWTGKNWQDVYNFINRRDANMEHYALAPNNTLTIKTIEGEMTVLVNDWIICGIKGELYSCKPDEM